jgi:hypothetical protein
MKRYSWLLLIALVIAGCADTSKTDTKTTTGDTGTTKADETKDAAPTGPTLADLPAELKHEGYEYYGLGRNAPIKFISKMQGRPDQTGTLEYRLVEIKDGKAVFDQDFSGDIAKELADSKLLLDAKGVHSTTLGEAVLETPQVELPAKVTVGASWGIAKPFTANGTTFSKFSSKIAGMEKVSVPLGDFEAAKVVANVEMTQGGTKQNAVMTAWYVKGVGTVKLSMVVNGPVKQERTMLATK